MVEPDRDPPRPDGERAPGQKSPDAFRTISEVSSDLDIPQHVLGLWEGKFTQIRPLKRAGGRRYYRPDDVELLRGIQHLLYGDGYTIKGVQKILREQGIRHVVAAGRRDDQPDVVRAAPSAPTPAVEPPSVPFEAADLADAGDLFEAASAESGRDDAPAADIEAKMAEADHVETNDIASAEAALEVFDDLSVTEMSAGAPPAFDDDGEPLDQAAESEDFEDEVFDEAPVEPIYATDPDPREADERGRIEPTFDPLPPWTAPAEDETEPDKAGLDEPEILREGEAVRAADTAATDEPILMADERQTRAKAVLAELETLRDDYHRRLTAIRRNA